MRESLILGGAGYKVGYSDVDRKRIYEYDKSGPGNISTQFCGPMSTTSEAGEVRCVG